MMEQYLYRIIEQVNKLNSNVHLNADGTVTSYLQQAGVLMASLLENSLFSILNLSSFLLNFIIGLLLSIYILMDKDRLILEAKRIIYLLFNRKNGGYVIDFCTLYHNMISSYIGIKAVDSTIIGCMAFVLLNLVDSNYALLLAVIVGFTNMIPYFGPFVGEIIGVLLNLWAAPIKPIMVFIVLFFLQQFDGWYLDPKLVGNRVGVRPIWIIYAVVIGGGFFGAIGMLLASPTAAVIKIYYHKLLKRQSDQFTIEELPQ